MSYVTPLSTLGTDAASVHGTSPEPLNTPVPAPGTNNASSPSLAAYLGQLWRQVIWHSDKNLRAARDGTLTIGVNQGYYRYAGTDTTYNGANGQALTNNATNYVYLDGATNTLVINTTGFPATPATYFPIAVFVTSGGVITTADYLADRRDLVRCSIESSSSSPAGTDGTSFTLDQDNAGAGANGQFRHNRGSTDAEDAALEFDETNDRWRALSQHTTRTLCPIEGSKVYASGTEVIDSSATLLAAGIAAARLYTFGANGGTAYGIKMSLGGATGAPSSGAHTAGELALDSAGVLWICTVDGTPGTWQQAGKQDGTIVLSIANGAGAAAGAAQSFTIQAKDNFGTDVAQEVIFDLYLMDDAAGAADAANVSAFSVTTGTAVRTITANKAYRIKTNASGTAVVSVTNSIADTVYLLAVQAPGSPALNCSDTGSGVWS